MPSLEVLFSEWPSLKSLLAIMVTVLTPGGAGRKLVSIRYTINSKKIRSRYPEFYLFFSRENESNIFISIIEYVFCILGAGNLVRCGGKTGMVAFWVPVLFLANISMKILPV